MHLKVIGDPQKAAEALKTNRPLVIGQVVNGQDAFLIRELSQKYPDLFELVSDGIQGMALPSKNKLLKKSGKFFGK